MQATGGSKGVVGAGGSAQHSWIMASVGGSGFEKETGVAFSHSACIGACTETGGVFGTGVGKQHYYVALTPSTAKEFILHGHKVYFQSGFALKAGFHDDLYTQVGAIPCQSMQEVYQKCNIMLKVSPPQESEYAYIQPQQVIFCFMDTMCSKQQQQQQQQQQTLQHLLRVLGERKATLVSYTSLSSMKRGVDSIAANTAAAAAAATNGLSTVTPPLSSISTLSSVFSPVYTSFCEVYGYVGMQQVMSLLQQTRGRVMGGLAAGEATRVLILGGGPCGFKAASLAAAAGGEVIVMDADIDTLHQLSLSLPSGVRTLQYTHQTLEELLPTLDVVVSCIIPTSSYPSPILLTEKQMGMLKQGCIVADLAACVGSYTFPIHVPNTITTTNTSTTTTNTTTTSNTSTSTAINTFACMGVENVYNWRGLTVYLPTDLLSLAANTSSTLLSISSLPFILHLASRGWRRAVIDFIGLQEGVFVAEGVITNPLISIYSHLPYTPIEKVLEQDILSLTNTLSSSSSSSSNLTQLKQQLYSFRSHQSNPFTIHA